MSNNAGYTDVCLSELLDLMKAKFVNHFHSVPYFFLIKNHEKRCFWSIFIKKIPITQSSHTEPVYIELEMVHLFVLHSHPEQLRSLLPELTVSIDAGLPTFKLKCSVRISLLNTITRFIY